MNQTSLEVASGDIIIHMGGFPLVECHFPDEAVDDDKFRGFLAELVGIQERARAENVKFVLIVDGSGGLSPQQRKMYANWALARKEWEDTSLPTFVALPLPFMRGVLTALGWLIPKLRERVVVCPTYEEAKERAVEALRAQHDKDLLE